MDGGLLNRLREIGKDDKKWRRTSGWMGGKKKSLREGRMRCMDC